MASEIRRWPKFTSRAREIGVRNLREITLLCPDHLVRPMSARAKLLRADAHSVVKAMPSGFDVDQCPQRDLLLG
jgi:hypothetical protein